MVESFKSVNVDINIEVKKRNNYEVYQSAFCDDVDSQADKKMHPLLEKLKP